MVRSRNAGRQDLGVVEKLLKNSGLPFDDCSRHIDNFIIVEENEKVIGTGGLEIHGDIGLLRSMVVVSEYRGRGIGRKIYKLLENSARAHGVHTLYLLTETAADYFKKLDFQTQNRNAVPTPIKNTAQFTKLCPSSATVMFRRI